MILDRIGPDYFRTIGTTRLRGRDITDAVSGVFSSVAAWNDLPWGSIVHHPVPERVKVREATEGYLALHGVAPIEGRGFTERIRCSTHADRAP